MNHNDKISLFKDYMTNCCYELLFIYISNLLLELDYVLIVSIKV